MLTLEEVNERLDRYISKQKERFGRYSLQDLGRELGYSIQQISDVRRGRRTLKADFALKVKELTDLKPDDYYDLSNEQVAATQDITHYHIMSLAKLSDQRADPHWIATRLGIKVEKARECFERLLAVGLLRVVGDRFEQTHERFTTVGHATTELMYERYRQHAERGFRSFLEDPKDSRMCKAITLALPTARVAEARAIIEKCLRELDQLEADSADTVCSCFVQFFPVTPSQEQPSELH